MTENPHVSIIILNYNGIVDTSECLHSLQNITYNNYEVIVVDNGSKDNPQDTLRKKFPKVTLLENEKNMGFGEGNNIGIRTALMKEPKYILLLNNDTVVDTNFLNKLVNKMEKNPSIAVCSPKIKYYQEPSKIWYLGTHLQLGYPRLRYKGKKDDNQLKPPNETYSAIGCAFLMRTEAIKEIGMLDESLFIMHEETDWCLRAKARGYKCSIEPESIVYHKVSSSIKMLSDMYLYYVGRNWIIVSRKNFKTPMFFYVLLTELCVRFPYYTYLLIKTRRTKKILVYIEGLLDGIKNKTPKKYVEGF